MKDLIEIVSRVQRGLDAYEESDEDFARHNKWRVRHSEWLYRQQNKAESKKLEKLCDISPHERAWARVDRDLVARGIAYLPMWMAWRMGGSNGRTRKQIKRRVERCKDTDRFKEQKAELLAEALDLLMGRRVLAPTG